jgi:hypothetical protein
MDCKDGHPKFTARKSLEFVCEQLKKQDGLDWVQVWVCARMRMSYVRMRMSLEGLSCLV